jgi:hypothetical protein
MLSRKKGFEVIDAEELFHQMHNPYYENWKIKKSQYVKYEKLQDNKKKKLYRPSHLYKPENNPGLETEKEKYYAKEVRTFDEVFK